MASFFTYWLVTIKLLIKRLGLLLFLIGCTNTQNFEPDANACNNNLVANATLEQVKALYKGNLLQIQEDWVIKGYINSSDKEGNFFASLHFQDKPTNATQGLQIEVDLFETHLLFEPGQKIFIKTKGLYLGKSGNVYKLGGTFTVFGVTIVGRLPALAVEQHIFRSCDGLNILQPNNVGIAQLDTTLINNLVQLEQVQFQEDILNENFADFEEETVRQLEDCEGNTVGVLNSGYANFQAATLPNGSGAITGVLTQQNQDFYLVIRDTLDVAFTPERCPDLRQTNPQIFFSELADPNNNNDARFIEIYNSSTVTTNLEGWTINRYTNANTTIGSSVDLSGYNLAPNTTLVIAANGQEFENVYGFMPNINAGTNSPADSNGDDNLTLVDPFGTTIDIFGIVGEDGSGTNHEFEDGRAVRKSTVTQGSSGYNIEEWTIFNDTGGQGTTNKPQNAPEDFTPGSRE